MTVHRPPLPPPKRKRAVERMKKKNDKNSRPPKTKKQGQKCDMIFFFRYGIISPFLGKSIPITKTSLPPEVYKGKKIGAKLLFFLRSYLKALLRVQYI